VSKLGELIQAYQDQHGTSDRALARRINVAPTLIGRWKRGKYVEVPKSQLMHALSDQLGLPIVTVMEAVLIDTKYLPEAGDEDAAGSSSSMNAS
jgi:transcriptional regulator with XRE-family HTH domain